MLIEKQLPDSVLPNSLHKGIQSYLTYLNPDSDLMQYIHKHRNLPEEELLLLLLTNFKEYGLGDTHYIELMRTTKKEKN